MMHNPERGRAGGRAGERAGGRAGGRIIAVVMNMPDTYISVGLRATNSRSLYSLMVFGMYSAL